MGIVSAPFRSFVLVSRGQIARNYRNVCSVVGPGVDVLGVVKADAYGHGAIEVARVLVAEGARWLAVSSVDEGVTLREAGLRAPRILVMGGFLPDEGRQLAEHQLTPVIHSLAQIRQVERLAQSSGELIRYHLKIDSGFGRIGVSLSNAPGFIRQVAGMPGLLVEGIYTHFASSDVDPDYTQAQAQAFLSVVRSAATDGIRPRWIHMANSSALLRFPETHGTLVRPGLAFYGVSPYPRSSNVVTLSPALSWKSRVIFLKSVPEGSPISYARTWSAKRPTRVATLAVGYADGLPRIVSNKGQVLIGGRRVPILGRVTMDMTMVDVTDVSDCHVGDEAVLLGRQGAEEITANDLAEWAQTSSYEILCGIAARVPRLPACRQAGMILHG